MAEKMDRIDAADDAEYNRVQSVLAERELAVQAGIQSHLMNEHQDGASAPQQESWWDSAWNWAFENQTELSFGTGIAIGAVAAIGLVAGIITAPAWLVIGGVALLTAGVITAGTLIVNNHFGLEPSTNLVDNIITGVVPALALTGAGYLLAAVAPIVGTAITNTCANNPTACSYIGPVVDFGEQAILATQMAYYGLTNDQENLAMTTVEWQMELNDGGLPGNTLTHEASEQLSRLSPEALELVGQYGDDAIDALQGHVIEVDNVAEFVTDLKDQFPNARVWASETSGRVYVSNSTELALNASQQLALTNANGGEITILISEIAEGSTHGSGNRVVLGTYDANGGYIGDAVENGGIFFDTGDAVWDNLKNSGIDPWLVNEQFLRNQLESGVEQIDFISGDVWSIVNSPDPKVSDSFGAKEIKWLLENADNYGYELQGNSWVLVKP